MNLDKADTPVSNLFIGGLGMPANITPSRKGRKEYARSRNARTRDEAKMRLLLLLLYMFCQNRK
jgi:hypothetical protein